MGGAMAAPKFAPAGQRESHYYTSPDVVPDRWTPDRPGIVDEIGRASCRERV